MKKLINALALRSKSQILRAKVRSFMSNKLPPFALENHDFSSKILPLCVKKIHKRRVVSHALKGMNASYDPRFYFISKGAIYLRASFEEAYKSGFNYKFIDIVRDF